MKEFSGKYYNPKVYVIAAFNVFSEMLHFWWKLIFEAIDDSKTKSQLF